MAEHMELLGADYCEHNVFHPGCGVTRAVSVLGNVPKFSSKVDTSLRHVGNNRGHDQYIHDLGQARRISPFTENPVRKFIISRAERISAWLGVPVKKSEGENKVIDSKY